MLTRQKIHRLSGPAVVIGYLILIPSVLGIVFSAIMVLLAISTTSSGVDRVQNEATAEMRRAEVPEAVITKVIANSSYTPTSYDGVNEDQVTAIKNAEITLTAGTVGNGIGAAIGMGFFMFTGVASFIGGLVGWILVMRKKVLKCSTCQAVVSAS